MEAEHAVRGVRGVFMEAEPAVRGVWGILTDAERAALGVAVTELSYPKAVALAAGRTVADEPALHAVESGD
ncbi:MAG: hypothetical protein GY719_32370 [bacterium]|nr:hypothetical protein [bacterium]